MYTLSIDTFLTVVRAGSLTRAASALNLAQTTVSHRLTVLEQELGFILLERGKGIREVRLTPSGEEFFKLAEQWSHIWHAITVLKDEGPMIRLAVGSVDSFNTFMLSGVYQAMGEHEPPVKLRIHTLHSREIYAEVENRRIDVGFAVQDLDYPNVSVETCFESPMVVLCLEAVAARFASGTVHPRDLDTAGELMMPWGQSFLSWHEHWWDPGARPGIFLDNAHMLLGLLRYPEQWAIVPAFVADRAMARGPYSVLKLAEQPPAYVCYRVTHRRPTSSSQAALSILNGYLALWEMKGAAAGAADPWGAKS